MVYKKIRFLYSEECYDRNTTRCHENGGGEDISLPDWCIAEDLLEKMVI